MRKSKYKVKGGQKLINSFFTVLSDVTNISHENRIESTNNTNILIPPLPNDTPTNDYYMHHDTSLTALSSISSSTSTSNTGEDTVVPSICAYGTIAPLDSSKQNRHSVKRNCTTKQPKYTESSDDADSVSSKKYKKELDENKAINEKLIYDCCCTDHFCRCGNDSSIKRNELSDATNSTINSKTKRIPVKNWNTTIRKNVLVIPQVIGLRKKKHY